jgi:hypothetical protein
MENTTKYLPGEPVIDHSSSIPELNEKTPGLKSRNAFYAASFVGGEEKTQETFNAIREEYETTGFSNTVYQVEQQLLQEHDITKKNTINSIINDANVPQEEKRAVLQDYIYGNTPVPTLKDKYIEGLSELELENKSDDEIITYEMSLDKEFITSKSIEIGEGLQQQLLKIREGDSSINLENTNPGKALKALSTLNPGFTQFFEMSDVELEKDNGFFYSVGVNLVQIVDALVIELLPYIVELGTTIGASGEKAADGNLPADVLGELLLTDDEAFKATKNWTELRDYIRTLSSPENAEKIFGWDGKYIPALDYKGVGIVGDVALNARDLLQFIFRVGGLAATKEEYEHFISQESATVKAFTKLDEWFQFAAEKITPDDPGKSKVFIEIAAFFAFYGVKKGAQLAIRTQRRSSFKDAGYDSTISDLFSEIDKVKLDPVTSKDVATAYSSQSTPIVRKVEAMDIINSKVLDNAIDPTSPVMTAMIANPRVGARLVKKGVEDVSGTTADSLGTTRSKLIDLAFIPSISLFTKPKHIDLKEWTMNQRMYKSLGEEYFNHDGFLFSQERKSWIQETDNVLDQSTAGIDLYQRNSDSLFVTTPAGLNASIVFSKNPTTNFKSVNDAITAAEVISAKVKETGLKDFKVTIEQVNGIDAVIKPYTIDSLRVAPEFKVVKDSVENLTTQVESLRAKQKYARALLLDKKELQFQSELYFYKSVDSYKKYVINKAKAREVELQESLKELQIAESLNTNGAMTPNFRIRVLRSSEWFDVGQAINDGFNKPPVRAWWGTKALFGSKDAWNWFVQFGSKNKKLEESMHSAGLHSQAWLKNQLQEIQKKVAVMDSLQRADMKALYIKQIGLKDMLSLEDIRLATRPNIELKIAEQYQALLYDTRLLDRFRFQAENLFKLGQLREGGYTEAFKAELRNEKGELSVKNVVGKTDFELIGPRTNPDGTVNPGTNPKTIFDFANDKAVENIWREVNALPTTRRLFEPVNNKVVDTGLPIYRLAETHYDVSGRAYEYGVFRNQSPQALPQMILNLEIGHMPAIMTGTKFVRSYPKVMTVNGKVIDYTPQFKDGTLVEGHLNFNEGKFRDYTDQMGPYKRAVMMANTELSARRWMEGNPSYMKTDTHFYRIEDANELVSLDRIEAQVIRQNAQKASKMRSDAKIENSEYMDVFSSFVLTTEANGSRAFIAPVLAEYKLRWMKEYNDKGLVNIEGQKRTPEGSVSGEPVFPIQKSLIKSRDGLEKVYDQAIKEWDQIAVLDQGFENNWISKTISSVSGAIAKYADKALPEKLSLLETAIQKGIVVPGYKIQKKPTAIQNVPMRVTSQLKIQWQFPMWHWMIQTANSWGHLAVAGYTGFNPTTLKNYYTTAGQSASIIAQMVLDTRSNKRNFKGIVDGLDWMENQSSITKSADKVLDLSAKDRTLIIQSGLKSGFFHIADHTFAKNFWKPGPKELTANKFTRTVDKTNTFVGRIGFEQGELMGRVNTWMASRIDWVQKNPGINWRSTSALAEITAGARKLAGSMDSYGEMRIQRVPILATFAQFSSFIMKSGEAMWNTSATPFNPKQMAALSAWNFSVYGIRGGMWYGSWVMVKEILSLIYDEDEIDAVMNEMDDLALINIMMNGFGDAILPTYDEEGNLLKSDLEFNMRMSPMGSDMPMGGYGQMYNYLMKDGAGNESFGPSGKLLKDIWGENGVTDLFQAIWSTPYNDRDVGDKVVASAKVLSKLSGLTSGTLRYIIGLSMNDKMTKEGQLSGEGFTKAEKYFWGWSSTSSRAERIAFEYFKKNKTRTEQIDTHVKTTYLGIIAMYGNAPTVYQLAEHARALKYALHGSEYMDEAYYNDFWEGLTRYQDRTGTTRQQNIFQKAIENYQPEPYVSKKQLATMRLLLKSFESLGKNHPNYQSLLHIVTVMENGNKEYSEEDILKYRKNAFNNKEVM